MFCNAGFGLCKSTGLLPVVFLHRLDGAKHSVSVCTCMCAHKCMHVQICLQPVWIYLVLVWSQVLEKPKALPQAVIPFSPEWSACAGEKQAVKIPIEGRAQVGILSHEIWIRVQSHLYAPRPCFLEQLTRWCRLDVGGSYYNSKCCGTSCYKSELYFFLVFFMWFG